METNRYINIIHTNTKNYTLHINENKYICYVYIQCKRMFKIINNYNYKYPYK